MWKQQPWEVLQSWIDAIILEASDDLNDWEAQFVNDMTIKVHNRWSLSQKQEQALEKIYAEKTS